MVKFKLFEGRLFKFLEIVQLEGGFASGDCVHKLTLVIARLNEKLKFIESLHSENNNK